MNSPPYGFRIVGATWERRRLVDAAAALAGYAACDERCQVDKEAYLSAFQFGDDFRRLLTETGSTAGFTGACWSPWLWFDIDRTELTDALKDTIRLAANLDERYRLPDDSLLLFFSGRKGFHIGLPTCLWSPAPSDVFHKTARRFAENVAQLCDVTIDTGVYDRVRAFRAPNSRHAKSGLHKRQFSYDELTGLSLERIVELAREPAPFDLPTPTATSEQAAADWQAAIRQVEQETEAKAARRVAGVDGATLNQQTLGFIREGAGTGDRHRLLFSAAANLAEFGCPPSLAHALLEEAGLDCGLAPKEVRRQIDCGLSSVGTEPTPRDAPEPPQTGGDDAKHQSPPKRNSGDSTASQRQSCQQVTRATVPTQDALAALWQRTAPPPNELVEVAEPAAPTLPGPTPPTDAKLYLIDENMRPCSLAECFRWTWEGGPQWFDAAEYPPPGAKEEGEQ